MVPGFLPSPGWHVRVSRASAPSAIAATIPIRDPSGQFPPHRTLAALPSTGVVVHVTNYGARPVTAQRRLPLSLSGVRLQHRFEGVPAKYAFQRIRARVSGSSIDVIVFYGNPRPTAAEQARANAEVRRLTLRR
jgi:hypothetical protein